VRNFALHRVIDVAIVLAASPVVVPLCLLLMLLIKRNSVGRALFAQQRMGRHQKPFRLFKLRTMASDTGDRPSHEVSATYITSIGHVLRRTKLDELPQLWNILKGEMTFVGPRPCLPSQRELIDARAFRGLFDVLPGITGPAQIRGIDMATPLLMAEVEAEYFRNSTLVSDLKILIETVLGAGSGDAVSKNR
jgi:O-antigen biosynthesis protein WbqP